MVACLPHGCVCSIQVLSMEVSLVSLLHHSPFVAIAASAPIWGLPLDSCPIDSSAKVVTYSASTDAGAEPLCIHNLKSSYILLNDIGSTSSGREYLSSQLNLCTPLQSSQDIQQLLYYLQSPLFNLAEGSFPFPSSYITFALTGTHAELPPWAMQVMCSSLGSDYSIVWNGDIEKNSFTLSVKDLEVTVDWDLTSNNGYTIQDIENSGITALLQNTLQAIQIWYNVTETLPSCINWDSIAPNLQNSQFKFPQNSLSRHSRSHKSSPSLNSNITSSVVGSKNNICTLPSSEFDAATGWNTLVCNEGINLVNWWAQGMGDDLYWPPNQPQGTTMESMISTSLLYCKYYESIGLYGLPQKEDLYSKWLDTVYGGLRIQYASNIVFSNGNLDPWSPAGVTPSSSNDGSVISLMIDMGGHHLDLFWSNENDPQSVK